MNTRFAVNKEYDAQQVLDSSEVLMQIRADYNKLFCPGTIYDWYSVCASLFELLIQGTLPPSSRLEQSAPYALYCCALSSVDGDWTHCTFSRPDITRWAITFLSLHDLAEYCGACDGGCRRRAFGGAWNSVQGECQRPDHRPSFLQRRE